MISWAFLVGVVEGGSALPGLALEPRGGGPEQRDRVIEPRAHLGRFGIVGWHMDFLHARYITLASGLSIRLLGPGCGATCKGDGPFARKMGKGVEGGFHEQ